jgi:hypothetical protein
MKFTISASLLSLAMFTTTTIATQVNSYHDDNCGDFAYAVYSANWGCQNVDGVQSLKIASSSAKCNVYSDTNCQNFYSALNNPGCSGSTFQFGSIACEY